MGKICGMDVSYAQGSINWEQVKASKKIEFAILRAGYGRETSQVDTQYCRRSRTGSESLPANDSGKAV